MNEHDDVLHYVGILYIMSDMYFPVTTHKRDM